MQRYAEDLKEALPEVDAFIRIDDYPRIKEILLDTLHLDFAAADLNARSRLTPSYFAYLKIAEGCNHRCAYCAIPLIRGRYQSRPIEELVEEAKGLAAEGVKELNLIAQDCAYYGRDLYGHFALGELLKQLDELPFTWIRILYLYPDEMSEELLRTVASCRRVLPYFDMPVQYGSDRILKAMRRPTSTAFLREKFALIHEIFGGKEVLRTTFMVGFPGEEEEDFRETLQFIREQRFDSLGAFTYSREEDTPSYDMPDQVEEEIKERRYRELMETQKAICEEKNAARIGQKLPVLVEKNDPFRGISTGRAYFSAPEGVDPEVRIRDAGSLRVGEFVMCEITGYREYDLLAVIAEEEI